MSKIEELLQEQKQSYDSLKSGYEFLINRSDELEAKIGRIGLNAGPAANGPYADPRDEIKAFYKMLGKPVANVDSTLVDQFKHYDRALNQYLVGGESALTTDMRNTLSVGSDPGGGYYVLPTRSSRIIEKIFETDPIRAEADYMGMTSGDSLELLADTGEAESEWVGETETRADTGGIEVKKIDIPLHEIYAQPKATQKLLDTAGENVGQIIETRIAKAFARKGGQAFVSGNGVTRPKGFLTYTAVTTTDDTRAFGQLQYIATGTSGSFGKFNTTTASADDVGSLVDLQTSLKSEYLANAKFYMARSTAGTVRKMRDENGNLIWQNQLQAGQPALLLGHPVVLCETMPAIGADSLSIAFGDMRQAYTVIDMPSIRILRDPFTSKPYVKFYAYYRMGGGLTNSDALKLLKFSAS
ncbi:MAG: phage major capsid protein [Gammaproteobacteria bacterium]|nr:phage major capsid protein [Gammaproteobacteria bacterium]